jgi:D-alanine transaminase
MELAMVDDAIMPLDEARISIHDRCVYFGEGVYEVIACRGGRLFEAERHLARLKYSLGEMEMLGKVDLGVVADRIGRAVSQSGLSDAVVYLQISRGTSYRSHEYPADWQPTFLMTVRSSTPATKASGTAITHPDIRWKRCDVKTLNLLGNIMAKNAAVRAGAYEAILVDDQGFVTEGSSTSVLMVKNNTLYTAPLTANILPGITRGLLLEWARQDGVAAEQTSFTKDQAMAADELMISGTITGVKAMTQLDGRAIGGGKIGPITQHMQQRLTQAMKQDKNLK